MGTGTGGPDADPVEIIDSLIQMLKYIKSDVTKITKLETDFSNTHLHLDIELEGPKS